MIHLRTYPWTFHAESLEARLQFNSAIAGQLVHSSSMVPGAIFEGATTSVNNLGLFAGGGGLDAHRTRELRATGFFNN